MYRGPWFANELSRLKDVCREITDHSLFCKPILVRTFTEGHQLRIAAATTTTITTTTIIVVVVVATAIQISYVKWEVL